MMGVAPALRAARCSACRLSALRDSLASLSRTRAPRATTATPRARALLPVNRRSPYSTFRALEEHAATEESKDPATPAEVRNDAPEAPGKTLDPDTPWYLQVDPPKHPTLVHEPAPLPDIPEGTPRVLALLVPFVAQELGVDDVKLLDLRAVDPPAALGPNLVMLFGTARSTRHLHIAGGRLVRWFRDRGISANADGLLGRNELKIKLKRAARYARRMKQSADGRVDDGITTHWICVNAGTVGGSHEVVEFFDEEGRPTGFGVPQTGTTIVVQLLTETGWQEHDVEEIWKSRLKHSLERKARADEGVLEPPSEPVPLKPSSGRRFFSTSARQYNTETAETIPRVPDIASDAIPESPDSSLAVPKHTPEGPESGFEQPHHKHAHPLQDLLADETYQPDKMADLSNRVAHDDASKQLLLAELKSHLSSLPQDMAIKAIETGKDTDLSPFLRLYHHALENLAPVHKFGNLLWLSRTAARLGAPGYVDADARVQLRDFERSHTLTRQDYLDLIWDIYSVPAQNDAEARDQALFVMEIVDILWARGDKVLETDLIVAVLEAVLRHPSPAPEAQRVLAQFEELLRITPLTCPTDGQIMRLLEAYAQRDNWDAFWNVWRIPPRYSKARSSDLYIYLYLSFAHSGHRTRCLHAVRETVRELPAENPSPVDDGRVIRALRDCVQVAGPMAYAAARNFDLDDSAQSTARLKELGNLMLELGVSTQKGFTTGDDVGRRLRAVKERLLAAQ